MTDTPCTRCGKPHPGCTAHSKRHGGPCGKQPIKGSTVCYLHGGSARQVKAAAADRIAHATATAEAARFAARTDIHPAEALIELVHYQAGIVTYWRTRVEDVTDQDLTWGTTKTKTGGDDHGTTQEAKPHIAYTLLVEAQDKLATYAAAALKAGVDERRVRLAETQGAAVAHAIRAILDALNLTPDQQALVPTIVPAQLRALTAYPAPA